MLNLQKTWFSDGGDLLPPNTSNFIPITLKLQQIHKIFKIINYQKKAVLIIITCVTSIKIAKQIKIQEKITSQFFLWSIYQYIS